jgi:hypothetical protein
MVGLLVAIITNIFTPIPYIFFALGIAVGYVTPELLKDYIKKRKYEAKS